MTIKEKTIRELDSLKNDELRVIYDLIKSLKRRPEKNRGSLEQIEAIRKDLNSIEGSLSSDIIDNRRDRI
jgi:uncharacterized protein YfkK (UPF0435 family)